MNNRIDWDAAYPPTPSEYHGAMMHALDHLEDMSMKRKHKATLTLVAALIALLAMSAAAVAAMNHFGILDFFGRGEEPLRPLESVESLIERDLGSAENGAVRLTIREAMYDGFGLHAVAIIEPVDPARFAVVDDIETPVPLGLTPIVLGFASITSDNAKLEDGEIFVSSDAFVMEGGALVQSAEGLLQGDAPEMIRLRYALKDGEMEEILAVDFELKNSADPRKLTLRPQAEGIEFRIVSAEIIYTQLAAYLDLTYEDWSPDPADEPVEVPDGTYYATPGGRFFHVDPACCGMQNAQPQALGALQARGARTPSAWKRRSPTARANCSSRCGTPTAATSTGAAAMSARWARRWTACAPTTRSVPSKPAPRRPRRYSCTSRADRWPSLSHRLSAWWRATKRSRPGNAHECHPSPTLSS